MKAPAAGIEVVLAAAAFAARKHRMQRRKDPDASPYINHPLSLAEVLVVEGRIRDAETLAAALLHDTVEDTETTYQELVAAFGSTIARVVLEVSDDRTLPKAERKRLQIKHADTLSRRAKLVKLADKICNLRDIVENPPTGWSVRRRREYFRWAGEVVRRIRGTNARLERAFDEVLKQIP
jgi:guanosine-3',5'-bis(diphosphate) 3'-pyrophosphohydrolase